MRPAEPLSRGRMAAHVSVDAPAAEAKRLRDAQRVRRYRDRQAMGQAVGRFLITEDLVNALVATGLVGEREALNKVRIEQAVAHMLTQFAAELSW